MTDNGAAYASHAWRARCDELGLRHLRTRPYTPRTNGKAERFIQMLLRSWVVVEVVLPGVEVDRLEALVLRILHPTLQQECLPGPPATVDADDARFLSSNDAGDPRSPCGRARVTLIRVDFGLDDLERRKHGLGFVGVELLSHAVGEASEAWTVSVCSAGTSISTSSNRVESVGAGSPNSV